MLTQDQVMEAMRPVSDPEIGMSIVDLGLIYGVDIEEEGKKVQVSMTLTSPMCPYGPELVAAAKNAVAVTEELLRLVVRQTRSERLGRLGRLVEGGVADTAETGELKRAVG